MLAQHAAIVPAVADPVPGIPGATIAATDNFDRLAELDLVHRPHRQAARRHAELTLPAGHPRSPVRCCTTLSTIVSEPAGVLLD